MSGPDQAGDAFGSQPPHMHLIQNTTCGEKGQDHKSVREIVLDTYTSRQSQPERVFSFEGKKMYQFKPVSLILLGFSQSVGSQIQFKSHQDEQTILLAICLTFQSEDLLCFSIITFFYMFCVFRIDEHFKTSPKVPGIDLNSTRVLFEKLMNSQHSMILEQVCSLHVYSAFITLGI